MEIDNNLLKEFAKITNDSETKTQSKYLRGTIVKNSGGKYVRLDGSTAVTPITGVIDVDEGDRVLVSIDNHRATIIGNFTFPPSARKEEQALNQSNQAIIISNVAKEKAQEASEKADNAISQSSIATASADEAKEQATEAITKANAATENLNETRELATQANTKADEAKEQAAASQASSAEAQAEVTRLQNEVASAQEDINNTLEQLNVQADEISGIKESYATKIEVGNTKADLETEITKQVGNLETKITENYSTKTENVELEGRLQSQITQNAEGLASQVTKTEKLESDTTQAQKDVADALAKAAAAQTAASEAKDKADAAQTTADTASANATAAAEKATLAKNAADAATTAANAADKAVQDAKTDLDEAKKNLANVISDVNSTKADIAEANQKVEAAQTAVNEALADAAEANLAATKAKEAADKAQQDAETAQNTASTAQQKADNAQTAADNAQTAANKAQADVAALTQRVTTAETTINQNSEAIELNANKITEIGDNLENNYYNKTETDAKIKVESDRISSTVTKIEEVEIKTEKAQFDADAANSVANDAIYRVNNISMDGKNLLLNSELGYSFINNVEDDPESLGHTEINENTVSLVSEYSGHMQPLDVHIPITQDNISIPLEDLFDKKRYVVQDGTEERIIQDYCINFSMDLKINGDINFMNIEFKIINSNSEQVFRDFTILFFDNIIDDESVHYEYEQDKWIKVSNYMLLDLDLSVLDEIPDMIKVNFFVDAVEGTTIEYRLPKLEFGTKCTEWTPAPEDVSNAFSNIENGVNERFEEVNTSMEKAQSVIDQLADMISHLVTDSNGGSLMTQTSNGWTFNISNFSENLNDIKDSVKLIRDNQKTIQKAITTMSSSVSEVSKKTAYISMSMDDNGDPCIELGRYDSNFKLRITNTAIDFLEGSNKIAYANNNTFNTDKMIVEKELQIGEGPGFAWNIRGNGNMGLVNIS